MTLTGFRARNHPQQVAKRGGRPDVDDRATTPEVFDPLMERFRFTIDVAASAENTKCERYYSIDDDGLSQPWDGERVWCNPPFSSIEPWVRKAHASECLTVMIVPANRTEQRWWQELVEPYRDCDEGFRVEFLPGRLRFLAPGDAVVPPNSRPPFGCCLLIWDPLEEHLP